MSAPLWYLPCCPQGWMCDYHLTLATPVSSVNEDPAQGGVATEGYGSSPELEAIMQNPQFAAADMHSRPMNSYQSEALQALDPMYWTEDDRAEAVLQGPSANEYHTPGTNFVDVVQPAKEFASSPAATQSAKPSCPRVFCQWHDEGASEKCGGKISCESVPTHFRDIHGIKKKNEFQPVTCRWERCFLQVGRKNFARHIRERHLDHIRGKGHSS